MLLISSEESRIDHGVHVLGLLYKEATNREGKKSFSLFGNCEEDFNMATDEQIVEEKFPEIILSALKSLGRDEERRHFCYNNE